MVRSMTVTSRLYTVLLKAGPAVTRDVSVRRDVVVRAPDGTGLLTDVYLAAPACRFPSSSSAPLMGAAAGHHRPAIRRARLSRGHASATRGTFGSGGQLDSDAEAADGRAAADWIVQQPWSNGDDRQVRCELPELHSVRTGLDQAAAAQGDGNRGLGRRAPRRQLPGRRLRPGPALAWTYTVGTRSVRSRSSARGARAGPSTPAFGHLPLPDADTVAIGHPVGFFRDSLEHDKPGDPYWSPTDFRPIAEGPRRPRHHAAGWYDIVLP